MKTKYLLFVILMNLQTGLFAQEKISLDDYQRASSFLYANIENKKIFNAEIKPNWFADSTGVWYVIHSPERKQYRQVIFRELKPKDLFDHEELARILSDSLKKNIKADSLPLTRVKYHNTERLSFEIEGKKYDLNPLSSALSITKNEKETNPYESISKDEKWIAYSKDYNLYIKSTIDQKEKKLSLNGKKNYEFASYYGWYDLMEGEKGERPNRFHVNWSDDNQWISTSICDLRNASKMFLLDWSIDSLYRPKLLSYYRGSPGDTNVVYNDPVFYHIESGKEIRPNLPRSPHFNGIDQEWSSSPGKVFLFQLSRGFQEQKIHLFDLNTETLQTIYQENSRTNISNFSYTMAEESGYIFFLSEKSGWRQLYALDLQTHQSKMLTGDGFYVNRILKVDERNKKIFFTASGKNTALNPYYQQLYSVSFKGKHLKLLTPEDRNHVVSMSPDGSYFFDNMSTVREPTRTSLRDSKSGKILTELSVAKTKNLDHWQAPEIICSTAHDGKTRIYAAIWKPTHFDPEKKYPIIDYSYTGPHTQLFPTRFTYATWLQSMAELGFIMIVIDGLGSSGRSKAFHNHSYKNLGGSLEDHTLVIKDLGKRYRWIDTTRVGIFGHSAGGYDAGRALLAYNDTYKVAVSSSADHDHRMEKAWWPEMYMGWPVDSVYHDQSNITQAHHLKGKLLIVHGGIDENVNPSASFKLAEALIKADKEFDMLILPSQRHGYRGKHQNYFRKVRWNYFLKHLRGVETLWNIE